MGKGTQVFEAEEKEQRDETKILYRKKAHINIESVFIPFRHRVCINVGGTKHQVLWSTLSRIPQTRLGMIQESASLWDLRQLVDDFCAETGELFYDRHPGVFSCILNFYR